MNEKIGPTIHKPGTYNTPGIYNGACGVYNGRGVYNDGSVGLIPFKNGPDFVYNGKNYKSKKINNLYLMIEFLDENFYTYHIKNNIKYYKATDRFNIENSVISTGWRLPTLNDIDNIINYMSYVKTKTGETYKDLINNNSTLWDVSLRGQDLTGLNMSPTGYLSLNNLNNGSTWFVVWSSGYSSQGNHAVSFERYGANNFGKGLNWSNSNYLPIVFVRDV